MFHSRRAQLANFLRTRSLTTSMSFLYRFKVLIGEEASMPQRGGEAGRQTHKPSRGIFPVI